MDESKIKAYFKRQVRVVIERSAAEGEGFLSYFAEHDARDEEILSLLAVSSMMTGEFHVGDSFPTPVEALAALTSSSRADLCREFRKALKYRLRALTPA